MPRILTDRTHLHYEIHGEGQPLLLIHGLGSSARDWEFQVPEFSRSYRVITFDLRGHGESDKPPGSYSIQMLAADTAGLLNGLGVEGVHVVGLSLGGFVAFQLAVDAPRLVKTLTVVNSAPELIARTFRDRLAIWQRLAIVRLFGMRGMGKVLARRFFVKPEQAPLREKFVARWAENDRRAYLATLRGMIGWSITERLDAILCPTLVVSSDQDYIAPSLKKAYTAKITNARFVMIPDSRHALPAEKPDEFNETLHAFLEKYS